MYYNFRHSCSVSLLVDRLTLLEQVLDRYRDLTMVVGLLIGACEIYVCRYLLKTEF